MQRHSFTALNSTFVVDSEYQFVKELGQGAYGCVVAAKHRRTGEGCAIKKITNINTKVCVYFIACVRVRARGRVLGPGSPVHLHLPLPLHRCLPPALGRRGAKQGWGQRRAAVIRSMPLTTTILFSLSLSCARNRIYP
jgi:hypothetical protein